MVLASATTPPLAPILSSTAPGQKDELEAFVLPYTTKSCDQPLFPPAMPQDVWDDLIKSNPDYTSQTKSTSDPATHHPATNAQTSTSCRYEADLAKMKADLATLLKLSLDNVDGLF